MLRYYFFLSLVKFLNLFVNNYDKVNKQKGFFKLQIMSFKKFNCEFYVEIMYLIIVLTYF